MRISTGIQKYAAPKVKFAMSGSWSNYQAYKEARKMTHHEENNQSKLIQNWNRVKPENKDIKITAIITVLDRLKSWDMKSFFF